MAGRPSPSRITFVPPAGFRTSESRVTITQSPFGLRSGQASHRSPFGSAQGKRITGHRSPFGFAQGKPVTAFRSCGVRGFERSTNDTVARMFAWPSAIGWLAYCRKASRGSARRNWRRHLQRNSSHLGRRPNALGTSGRNLARLFARVHGERLAIRNGRAAARCCALAGGRSSWSRRVAARDRRMDQLGARRVALESRAPGLRRVPRGHCRRRRIARLDAAARDVSREINYASMSDDEILGM